MLNLFFLLIIEHICILFPVIFLDIIYVSVASTAPVINKTLVILGDPQIWKKGCFLMQKSLKYNLSVLWLKIHKCYLCSLTWDNVIQIQNLQSCQQIECLVYVFYLTRLASLTL